MINLLFIPCNLPHPAHAICNLCLNLFTTVKLPIKFLKVLSKFYWKRMQGAIRWNVVMFLKSAELPVRAIKCLKWLIDDLSALKLAQPNPWLENYKFLQMSIKANVHYCRICNVKVPFWHKSSIFTKRSINLTILV